MLVVGSRHNPLRSVGRDLGREGLVATAGDTALAPRHYTLPPGCPVLVLLQPGLSSSRAHACTFGVDGVPDR